MNRYRYSYTDRDGEPQGLLNLSELRDHVEAGKVDESTMVTVIKGMEQCNARAIPGLFPGSATAKDELESHSLDRIVANLMLVTFAAMALIHIPWAIAYQDSVRGSDFSRLALGSYATYTFVVGGLVNLAAVALTPLVRKSRKLGFALIFAWLFTTTIGGTGPNAPAGWLGIGFLVLYYLKLVCFLYSFVRLVGAWGDPLE